MNTNNPHAELPPPPAERWLTASAEPLPPLPDEVMVTLNDIAADGDRDPGREGLDRLPPPVLGVALVTAIVANIALRVHGGVGNVASFVAVALTVAVVVAASVTVTNRSKVLLAMALLCAAWLPIRASGWLMHLNGWTAAALVFAAALFRHGPAFHPSSRHFEAMFVRGASFFDGGRLVVNTVRSQGGVERANWLPLLRGLALAVIPVAVFAVILASADAVFANFFEWGFDGESAFIHVVLSLFALLAIVGVVCISAREATAAGPASHPIGAVEALVVLCSVAALFAVFAIAQLVVALDGANKILREAGLTRAEYAREGFFQLLIVAALTLLLLASIRGLVRPTTGRVALAHRLASAVVSLLTVVIVLVSVLRLALYIDAFGNTTLRWYSTSFAILLGVIFVVFAAAQFSSTISARLGWVTLAAVFGALMIANAANPEARVAAHNLSQTDIELDANYLIRLSADAWPTILADEALVMNSIDVPSYDRGSTTVTVQEYFVNSCESADRPGGWGPLGVNVARLRLSCPG